LTAGGGIIEIQATAEKAAFDDAAFAALMALARAGTERLFEAQRVALDQ
jgi:ribonuclease PH